VTDVDVAAPYRRRPVDPGGGTVAGSGPVASRPLPPAARFEMWLLCAPAVLALVLPARLVVPGVGAEGRPSTLIAIGLFALWLIVLVRGVRRDSTSPAARITLALLWVVILLSYASGFDRTLSSAEALAADRELLRWLAMSGLVIALAEGVRSVTVLTRVLQAAVMSAAVMSLVGILQAFGFNIVPLIRVPGLILNAPLIGTSTRGDGGLARVAGTAAHYIEFGTVAALLLPLSLHFWMNSAAPRARLVNRWSVCSALLLSAVPFSLSRTSFLVLALTMAVFAICWSRRTWVNALILGLGAAVTFQTIRPGLFGTVRALFVGAENDPSVTGRLEDYPLVLAYIAERPILGRGPGTFLPDLYILLDNQVLLTLVSMGALGLAAIAAILAAAAVALGRVIRLARVPHERSLPYALLAVIAGATVASVTFDSLSFATFATVLWLAVGSAFGLYRLTVARAAGPPRRNVTSRPRVPRSVMSAGLTHAGASDWAELLVTRTLNVGLLPPAGPAGPAHDGGGAGSGSVSGGRPATLPAEGDPASATVAALDRHDRAIIAEPLVTRQLRLTMPAAAAVESSPWLAPLTSSKHLRSTVARGARASSLAQLFKLVLQILSTIVLFRILGPAAFGIVGMVLAVTALADLLREAGLANAVVTRDVVTQAQVSALFWINAGLGVALAGLLALLSRPLALFYGEPAVQWVTLGLCAVYVMSGLGVQHQALMQRALRFSSVAVRDAVAQGIAVAVAVGLALGGAGLWSLVALYVTAATVRTVAAWLLCSWRPSMPRIRVPGLRSLLRFGRDVTGFQLVNYAARNADNVLIGRFLGAEALGLYGRAYSLVLVPFQQITQPLGPPTIAALSRMREQPDRFRGAYRRILSTAALAGLPLVALMAVLADPGVRLVLGPQGEAATIIFQVLAIAAGGQVVSSTTGWLYLASERTGAMVRWALWTRPVIVLGFAVGLYWGPAGVAASYAVVTLALLAPGMANAARGTAVRAHDWLLAAAAPAVVALGAAAGALAGRFAGEAAVRAGIVGGPGANQALGDAVVVLCGLLLGAFGAAVVTVAVPAARRTVLDVHRSFTGKPVEVVPVAPVPVETVGSR